MFLYNLHSDASRVPKAAERTMLFEDVQDLQVLPDIKQRIRVVERMFRTYPWLWRLS